MDAAVVSPVVVVLAGPQASGKSTLAAGLRDDLRRRGECVALVELDQIAAMALPTLPSWTIAHRVFELVVREWAGADMSCVIAEGSGSAAEVAALRSAVPATASLVTVAVTVSFPVAYRRAQQDASRGVSRRYDFLEGVYQRWRGELARLDPDVVVDTEASSLPDAIEQLVAATDRARVR